MIDQHVRQVLPTLVKPILRWYARLNLTPNQLTSIGLFAALCASFAVAMGWFTVAIVLWWLGRFFDGTDGIYAREYKLESSFGAYWDFLADMAAYSLMILGFAHYFQSLAPLWLGTLFLYILCSTSALALGAQEQKHGLIANDNRGLRLGAGLAEGGETGIAYTVFCLFPESIEIWLGLWLLVLSVTVGMRTILAKKVLRA